MTEEHFYIAAFDSTSHSMQAEKKAGEVFRIAVIPTPRELTSGCGLAIRFIEGSREAVQAFCRTLSVPVRLYAMSTRRYDGKRRVETVEIIKQQ